LIIKTRFAKKKQSSDFSVFTERARDLAPGHRASGLNMDNLKAVALQKRS